MAHAYALYFDLHQPDRERRLRRIAAVAIAAAHVAALLWIARSPTPRRVFESPPSLVVVELGEQAVRTATAAHPKHAHKPATARAAAPQASAPAAAEPPAVPARRTFTEGHEAPGTAGAAVAPASGGAGSAATGDGAESGHSHFRPPRTLHTWLPPYPEDAFRRNHEGTVELRVTIDADGALIVAYVERSSGDASLDHAALASLDRYRFRAAERDGAPVRADAYVTINWNITPAVATHFGSPRIERIDPDNLAGNRRQTRYGSFLQMQEQEQDRDSTDATARH